VKLSAHFDLSDFIESATAQRKGIDNTPTPEIIENLHTLALGLEEVRAVLSAERPHLAPRGVPIFITSGYRCPKLNSAVGGARQSDHMQGFAADFKAPAFGTPLEICREIAASDINFRKLIHEGQWVHISFAPEPGRSVLTAHFEHGGVRYTPGLA
jgi:zinc D-Ala-D-Ala carboxypeptidase